MTVTVTVPATMSSDGTVHIYTDDSSPTTGLDGGGHVERLLPLILDNVSVASYVVTQASTASNSADLARDWAVLTSGTVGELDYSAKEYAIGATVESAKRHASGTVTTGSAKDWASKLTTTVDGTNYSAKQYALNAQASADAAAQQANTLTATSTTNTTIGTGSKTFTTQSGEQFIAGQFVTIASQANPANYMYGQVTSYSVTTLIVNVTAIGGTGTFADWLISLSGLQGIQGNTGATASVTNGNPTDINGLVKGNGSTLSPAVSGTDIKTVGGLSILGSGDVSIAGDATETSTNTHVSLISASKKVQAIAMTVSDKNVYLPNATTCQKGELFTIKNTGDFSFSVRTGGNVFLASLLPSQVATFSLTNTATDTWVVANNSISSSLDEFNVAATTVLNSTGSNELNIANITSTTSIIARNESDNLRVSIATLNSDNTFTQGTVVTVVSGVSCNNIKLVVISPTSVLLMYQHSNTDIKFVMLSISGTTITVNTIYGFAANAQCHGLAMLSATQFVATYYVTASTATLAVPVNISGVTISFGTTLSVAVNSSDNVRQSLIPLSATKALLGVPSGSYILTVSPTVITSATDSYLGGSMSFPGCHQFLYKYDSSYFLNFMADYGLEYHTTLAVSAYFDGTANKLKSSIDLISGQRTMPTRLRTAIVNYKNKIIYVTTNNHSYSGVIQLCSFLLDSNGVINSNFKVTTLNALNNSQIAACMISGTNKMILCTVDSVTSYLKASVIEVAL